jgi:hypothetical protein
MHGSEDRAHPLEPGADERTWLHRKIGATAVLSFFGFMLLTGAAAGWHRGRPTPRRIEQPIAFDHRKHVQDLELACSTCHVYYETQTFSGLPAAEICATCHAEAQGKSAEEAKLVKLLASGGTLAWRPLFVQPAHVFFSHRRHVVAGKLECKGCHGTIASSETPPGHVQKLVMQDCLDCHRRAGAATSCTTCHR